MKRKSLISFVLPYVIIFILFLLYRAKIIQIVSMKTILYFVIIGTGHIICGILLYYFIDLLNSIKKPDVIFLILHFINVIIMCFIIWGGMRYQFPIYNFVENSFLIIGIYIYKIFRIIRNKYLNK